MMKMKVEKVATKNEIAKIVESNESKSSKMKQLFLKGLDIKTISEIMQVRYNFVYNVVSNMIRVEGLESNVVKETKENKKDEIIKLLNEGKSNIEISKALKCNYNYVWKIVNEALANKK